MANSYLGFLDLLQTPEFYSTRTITDSSALGSSVAGFPASNVFTRNLYQPFKRSGLNAGQPAILDLDLVLCGADGSAAPFSVAIIAVMGLRAPNSVNGRESSSIFVDVHANSGGFSSTGGQTSSVTVYPASGNPQHAFIVLGGGTAPVTLNRYVRILVSGSPTTGSCTVNVGRVMVMPVIAGPVAPDDYAINQVDNSEIVVSYDGTPYRLSRPPSKTVAFTMRGLSPLSTVYSYAAGTFSSVIAANRLSAINGDAVFISEPAYDGTTNFGGVTYGRLAESLKITMDRAGNTFSAAPLQTYSASGTIIETPFA